METLARRWGEQFVKTTKKQVVLTVPAVWSDKAKHATLQAAERAGMGSAAELTIVSEPEAAAVYTLKAIQPNVLHEGDNFIVCDAGGGTVDLIAYKIVGLSPVRVEESAVGTGGLCGSAFLNYRFEDHVRGRIGEGVWKEMREKKGKTWSVGLKYFEEFVKRNFNDEEESEMNVPFPGLMDDEAAGLDCGFLTMTTAQVKSIVDPVVTEVIELVEGQVTKIREKEGLVKGIILVGGFGQSNYMYKRMKQHFNVSGPPPYTSAPTHAALSHQSDSIEVMHP
jgi:molecular chaperone DnaK (HSP70)